MQTKMLITPAVSEEGRQSRYVAALMFLLTVRYMCPHHQVMTPPSNGQARDSVTVHLLQTSGHCISSYHREFGNSHHYLNHVYLVSRICQPDVSAAGIINFL
jgi:hypothetical protein